MPSRAKNAPELRPSTPSSVAIHCDAHAMRDGQHFFRDAALRRPNALGTQPEDFLVQIETAGELFARVFGMAKPALRQRQSRRRHRSYTRIAHQRQNRVIERRGRELNRSLLRRLGMRRQNSSQQLLLARNHKLLIVERVAVPLGDQSRHILLFQKELVEPGKLRQDLQVGEILRLKISLRPFRMIAVLAKPFPQFAVPRIAPDQVLRIRLKQILQREAALVERQLLRRLGRHGKKWILRRPRDIVLNLHHQRRHQVEILVNVGKLVQQFDHAVVVFERVQPRPRQTIFACDQILVERLVLMPEQNDAQSRHGWSSQSSMR